MWAYPNMIPLPPSAIHGIWKALKPFDFDSTYGGFPGQNVKRPDLKAQVLESAKVSSDHQAWVYILTIGRYSYEREDMRTQQSLRKLCRKMGR